MIIPALTPMWMSNSSTNFQLPTRRLSRFLRLGCKRGASQAKGGITSLHGAIMVLRLSLPLLAFRLRAQRGGYGDFSGTSASSPHVVGVAALALVAGVTDVRGTLQTTAEDLGNSGWDELYGYGLVDAENAVLGISSAPPLRHTISSTGKLPVTWGELKGR